MKMEEIETSGVFDMDSELELWFSCVGLVTFEFTGSSDIVEIGRAIGFFIIIAFLNHAAFADQESFRKLRTSQE